MVARVLSVLDYIARADHAVSAAELSSALGIPRASAYRIFTRLEQEHVLVPEPNGRGCASGRWLSDLGIAALTRSSTQGARHRVLEALVEELGETCNLTMLSGSEVVYVDRVETDWPLRMHLSPGSRVPIHCTATGKLLVSLLPEERMRELIASAPLRRYTRRTITDPGKLLTALKQIRNTGVGVDDEEFATGMVAVSVPVLDARGRACAALAVHAPTVRLSLRAAQGHLARLREAATRLSKLLG